MAAIRPIAVANSAFRDARGHHRQRGVLRGGDRLEARHDAPDGAEQADERPAEPTVASTRSRRSSRSSSGRSRRSSPSRSASEPGEGSRLAFERSLPFAHCRATKHAAIDCVGLAESAIKFLDRLPGPERLLEAIHGALGARIQEHLVDGDRPDPDRTGKQPQHDRFHDPVGLQEQCDQRYVGGWQRQAA